MLARLLRFTCLRFVVDSTINIILTPEVLEQLEAFEQFGALAMHNHDAYVKILFDIWMM